MARDNKSTFVCPVTREEFQECDEPLLDGDQAACPHCGEAHVIEGSFPGTLVNRYACRRARKRGFLYVRGDRGALEFVAGPDTPDHEWRDKDGRRIMAYAIGDAVFWPSRAAMRRVEDLAHELCHVRQGRRHGSISFLFKYGWETLRHGYDDNRFERSARRAERRRMQRSGRR